MKEDLLYLGKYHPVIQAAKAAFAFGASMADQKYGPPLVGIAETISAMLKATNMAVIGISNEGKICEMERIVRWDNRKANLLKKLTTIHPTDMTPGPPVIKPYSNSLEKDQRQRDARDGRQSKTNVVMPVMTLWKVLC